MRISIFLPALLLVLLACTKAPIKQQEPDTKATFQNPIFSGDYPDPSILRDGEDFYMVHSSFEYYPGLLIWHSTDLINWSPVANSLHKYVGSVWAPELTKYEGKYYIYFPASNKNYVITADNISGPWTDPIEIDISMIDPGHAVDDDGNRFLFFSSGSYVPLTQDGLAVAGEVKHVYDGWEIPREWSIECFCMEGPKLFKRGEYFYLTVAEGGTAGPATGHMVISARSKSLDGPWENSPHNPILRTSSPDEKWWSVGHGTVFDDVDGNWWMVFHGYEKDHYNMGRQTMLTPIEWTKDDWYQIPDFIDITKSISLPSVTNQNTAKAFNDDFNDDRLNPQWKFFGGDDQDRFSLKDGLVVTGKGTSLFDSPPLLYIPSDHSYSAQVEVEVSGEAKAGLILFYNYRAFSGMLADKKDILTNLRGWQFPTEKEVINGRVYLKLVNNRNTVNMYYSLDGRSWTKTENSFEASPYHHNILSGFMSLRIGLVSVGDGEVKFKNFSYQPIKE
ncbi:family 43 glycosylhydrolase [Marinoscillum sp.]|uniref:family 43 glycosylhydrolase n=1 Tax=Marinoscillum sp. TaxID=2024838 RepID=UPI003BAB2072